MKYTIDFQDFEKYFITKDAFKHNSGAYFRLLPFVTSPNVDFTNLENVLGGILCQIQAIEPVEKTQDEIIQEIVKETDIEAGAEEEFREVVKKLFFDEVGQIRALNLTMMEQRICTESNEKRLAEYLADVLGDASILNESIECAKRSLEKSSNVLEALVYSKLDTKAASKKDRKKYFRVVTSLQKTFEEDFKYIVMSDNRTKEYLLRLFEFYYFTYTAQTFLQLNRRFDGCREENSPLYFSLDWEATKIHGKYISEGWNLLQEVIQDAYINAVVLEMLNACDSNEEQMDYISIHNYLQENPSKEEELRIKIDGLCNIYKEKITDCSALQEIEIDNDHDAEEGINYLYSLVKTQFDNTSRGAAAGRYADKFDEYCLKFLKQRGRNGYVLNISEETLIFLTKISIKDNEKMKLSEVFKEFESRGVFLEKEVREQVANYYEKLNLIEKKSDSGDAKYVKRIL